MSPRKKPTVTARVFELLIRADDFLSRHDIERELPDCNMQSINAALHHLRNHKAVDVIVTPDGRGWWYATPEFDDRSMVQLERVPENGPRRTRKGVKGRRKAPSIKS